jgi:hypothetical protein
MAPNNIDFVFGRLVDLAANQVVRRGQTLPTTEPYRWAIHFRRGGPALHPGTPYRLEVFGLVIGAQGLPTVQWDDAVDLTFHSPVYDIKIEWPDHDGENDLCASNFVPYGTYSPAGTVIVTLDCGAGPISPAWIYYDPTEGDWSAQFDPLVPVPTGNCTLTASLGISSSDIRHNLQFQNC